MMGITTLTLGWISPVVKQLEGRGTKTSLHYTQIKVTQMQNVRRLGIGCRAVGLFDLGNDAAQGRKRLGTGRWYLAVAIVVGF